MINFISTHKNIYLDNGKDKNMAIVIDGIIGAGKTTIAKFLSDTLNIQLYQEIFNSEQENLTQRMLDRFYSDQERWSAIIQVMFLNNRFRDIKTIEKNNNSGILDRSIYGDEIFAKTIYDRGQMSKDELQIYRELLSNMLEHIKPPDVLIYVDVTVETAFERIRQRKRSSEPELISKDYLEDLQKNYDLWYEEYNLSPKVKIDFNGEFTDRKKEEILSQINKHITVFR